MKFICKLIFWPLLAIVAFASGMLSAVLKIK